MAGNTRNSRKGVGTITDSVIALIELMKPIEYFLPNDEVIPPPHPKARHMCQC